MWLLTIVAVLTLAVQTALWLGTGTVLTTAYVTARLLMAASHRVARALRVDATCPDPWGRPTWRVRLRARLALALTLRLTRLHSLYPAVVGRACDHAGPLR